jgi:hypothetical protein
MYLQYCDDLTGFFDILCHCDELTDFPIYLQYCDELQLFFQYLAIMRLFDGYCYVFPMIAIC